MSVGARCTVERLSQNAMSPSFHLKRTVYSGRVMCSHRISRIFWLSPGVRGLTAAGDEYPRAFLRKTLGNAKADAGAAAGHQRGFTCKLTGHRDFLSH